MSTETAGNCMIAVLKGMLRDSMNDLIPGMRHLPLEDLQLLLIILDSELSPIDARKYILAMFPSLADCCPNTNISEGTSMKEQHFANTPPHLSSQASGNLSEDDDHVFEDVNKDDGQLQETADDYDDRCKQNDMTVTPHEGSRRYTGRVETPLEQGLAVLHDPSRPISRPEVPPRTSDTGRSYIPRIQKSEIIRLTGLDKAQWKHIRHVARSLFTTHKLHARKDGKLIPWKDQNIRNKLVAFSALEAEFKVLKRCVGHWATEAIFEAHYEYLRNKVGGSSLAFRMLTPQIAKNHRRPTDVICQVQNRTTSSIPPKLSAASASVSKPATAGKNRGQTHKTLAHTELALVASRASSTPDNNLPPTVSTINPSVSAGAYHIPPVSITSGLGKPLTLSSSVPCPTTESIQTRPSNPYDSLQLPNTYRNHGTKRGGAFQSLNVATNIADRPPAQFSEMTRVPTTLAQGRTAASKRCRTLSSKLQVNEEQAAENASKRHTAKIRKDAAQARADAERQLWATDKS